jgi:hypothetical protein
METVIFWVQSEPDVYKLRGWGAVLFGVKPGGADSYQWLIKALGESNAEAAGSNTAQTNTCPLHSDNLAVPSLTWAFELGGRN